MNEQERRAAQIKKAEQSLDSTINMFNNDPHNELGDTPDNNDIEYEQNNLSQLIYEYERDFIN